MHALQWLTGKFIIVVLAMWIGKCECMWLQAVVHQENQSLDVTKQTDVLLETFLQIFRDFLHSDWLNRAVSL